MNETVKTDSKQDTSAGSEWSVIAKETTSAAESATPEFNTSDTTESNEQIVDPRVDSLAILLARVYIERNYPKLEDGTFTPCRRDVNNEKVHRDKSPKDLMVDGMSKEDAKTAVIDIANTPFDQYSEHWKEANRGGAHFLIELVDIYGSSEIMAVDFSSDEEMRTKYGDLVHKNWMERNSWERDQRPELFVPFSQLPPDEQQKDIDQLIVLQEWLKQQATGESEA